MKTDKNGFYLVGVDCSTQPRKVGIALAEIDDSMEEVRVCDVHAGIGNPWEKVAQWLKKHEGENVLLALDAPLGWPVALGETLYKHSAGKPVDSCPDEMFHRCTDQNIKDAIGKRPLEVGADRIARTAHAALAELGKLSVSLSIPQIELAWSCYHEKLRGVHAIEVYPAGTLKSHGMPYKKYKERDQKSERCKIATKLREKRFSFPDNCWDKVLENADGLDAAVCLLAAADFIRGEAKPPPEPYRKVARREGWIWCFHGSR